MNSRHLSPVLGPEQGRLCLVVVVPALLRTDRQPQTELRAPGERGEHLLLGAGGDAQVRQVRAQHQGVEDLESIQRGVVPTSLALLHIGLEVDVSDSQGDSLEEASVSLDFVGAFYWSLSIFVDQSVSG